MPLPRPDDRSLPSRRSLRQAERALAAGADGSTGPYEPETQPVSRRQLRERRRQAEAEQGGVPPVVPPVVRPVVPPVAPPVADLLPDHVLEGGDDSWVDDVAPRPTPLASRVTDVVPLAPTRERGSAWRRVPQLLVVGALVAAIAGYASAEDVPASAGAVEQFVREEVPVAAEAATVLTDLRSGSALVADEDGLLRVSAEDEASRAGERTLLPGCDGVPPEVAQANGDIDERFLCTLWDGTSEIRADAAVSLALLNEEYRAEFGRDICITDGYRSYAAQQSLRARKPGLAARAGTSEHGYGLAVDLCGGVESAGPAYTWLRENAAEHGFENPRWAQRGGGGPYEPWHWEYTEGQW
ncbi:M15 family metallopeptidase [Aquipuribacter sp. MA13-6]|uniref:M15 family metallopeptidase n=1 Tax=unclassified Aquipuribacter TaxID=2635084 RepID=UPI003EEF2319